FFVYIGLYLLPQSESHPPGVTKIEEGISQENLILIGEGIIFGKGQCMVCHPMKTEAGMRSPAMATIGVDIEKNARQRGITPEEQLFDALVNPGKFVVKGFDDIMPPSHKSPTSLTEGEIIAVAAFLQSKGGKVTVSYPGSLPILREEVKKAGGS
ncbi:MAG: hypothetical protein AABY42_08355, partial [Nitrospirota bacterium]